MANTPKSGAKGGDKGYEKYDWTLNGKLITNVDPILIGENNFRSLKNFRYTQFGLRPVTGMSKINAAPTSYLSVQNGYYFKKDLPSENHVFAQTTTGANSRIVKSDNSAAIPNADTFSTWFPLSSADTAFFSKAPDNCMAVNDGLQNYVWGGTEYRTARFINFDPAGTFWYDFSDQVSNKQNTSTQKATLKRVASGIDSSTKALWHFDNAYTDSSGNSHTLTAAGAPTFTQGVFGGATGAVAFAGAADYAYLADSSDFDFSGGTWTIDGRAYVTSLAAKAPLYYQETVVNKFTYDTGSFAPTVGQTLYGETSGAVIKVLYFSNAGGWGGVGTGTIWYQIVSGTIQNAEHIHTGAGGTGNMVCHSTQAEQAGGNNHMEIYIGTDGSVNLEIYQTWTTSNIVSVSTAAATVLVNAWYFIQVTESGDSWYIFVGPTAGTAALMATATDTDRPWNFTGSIQLGYNGTQYFPGYMDEVRVSLAARNTAQFLVPLSAYGSGYDTYVYVGSTRPLQGIKFYVGTANATAATSQVYYWNGSAWSAVSSLIDGTVTVATKTLSGTGTISFTSTVSTAKVKVVHETECYFYECVFSGIDDNVTVYYATVDAPVQPIVDIWDGVGRVAAGFLAHTSSYADYTTNVYSDDYNDSDATTYCDVGTLTSSQELYLGFLERAQGFYIKLPNPIAVNTTANTVISISYWNGTAWVSVGAIEDGSSVGNISLNKSAIITWQGLVENTEFTTTVANNTELYYYKITFSETLSATVVIDYIYGIPSQVEVQPHRFSVLWQNRLWLCDEVNRSRNSALCSSYGTVSVFNGDDSELFLFGSADKLVAGATLFSRFGGSIYDNMILFKQSEIYIVNGSSPSDFSIYQISDQIGCVAPLTLVKCDVSYEVSAGITKHVLLWQGQGGIYMFDGNAVTNISKDIQDMFDPSNTNFIGYSSATNASFYDAAEAEYHWLTGTRELVFDLIQKKWFEITRGTGKKLISGWEVMDSYGNKFNYAGTTDGYIERLEYGTTMDGNTIDYSFWLGDLPLAKTSIYESEIRKIKLTGVDKNSTTQKVVLTHYGDCATTGTVLDNINQNVTPRCFQFVASLSKIATYHSLKFNISTNNETLGFEPLIVSLLYRVIRPDFM